MAMVRPSGKATRIAEKVVPGLMRNKRRRSKKPEVDFMSELEIEQTEAIDKRNDLEKLR